MIRCPLCKARYRNLVCSRCRADLSILSALEDDAARQAHRAVRELAAGNMQSAEFHAGKAVRKHATRFHALVYGFIASQNKEDEGGGITGSVALDCSFNENHYEPNVT